MAEWEYTKINLNESPRKTEDIDLLNDAGKAGWELIALTSNNVAYLKRGLSQQVQSEPARTRSRVR